MGKSQEARGRPFGQAGPTYRPLPVLGIKTTLVRRRHIQQLAVTKTIFQDRKGIANLKIGIRGGVMLSEIEVDYLAKEDVEQAWDWFQKTAA